MFAILKNKIIQSKGMLLDLVIQNLIRIWTCDVVHKFIVPKAATESIVVNCNWLNCVPDRPSSKLPKAIIFASDIWESTGNAYRFVDWCIKQ